MRGIALIVALVWVILSVVASGGRIPRTRRRWR